MTCACGHLAHHHAGGVACATLTVTGPPTPNHHNTAAPHLHMGRTVDYCNCRHYQNTTSEGHTA